MVANTYNTDSGTPLVTLERAAREQEAMSFSCYADTLVVALARPVFVPQFVNKMSFELIELVCLGGRHS